MSRPFKINRNEPCPCLTGKKYKNCCLGKVDWEKIHRQGWDIRPFLSIRGRNLHFTNRILEALQFDSVIKSTKLQNYKAAFTAAAVKKIHEAVLELWPRDIDIVKALEQPTSDVSGLYIGDYHAEYVTRAIVRH